MKKTGMSLVEILVALGITAVILAAITLFVGRAFRIPREQAEQGAIVDEARVELERLSERLVNARVENGEAWIEIAEPCDIRIRTNIDGDTAAEEVRITLDQRRDTLSQRIGRGRARILARSVRNDCSTTPLFTYFSLGGGRAVQLLPEPPDLTEIDRIALKLIIDVDVNQLPGPVVVETVVTPRGGEAL